MKAFDRKFERISSRNLALRAVGDFNVTPVKKSNNSGFKLRIRTSEMQKGLREEGSDVTADGRIVKNRVTFKDSKFVIEQKANIMKMTKSVIEMINSDNVRLTMTVHDNDNFKFIQRFQKDPDDMTTFEHLNIGLRGILMIWRLDQALKIQVMKKMKVNMSVKKKYI